MSEDHTIASLLELVNELRNTIAAQETEKQSLKNTIKRISKVSDRREDTIKILQRLFCEAIESKSLLQSEYDSLRLKLAEIRDASKIIPAEKGSESE